MGSVLTLGVVQAGGTGLGVEIAYMLSAVLLVLGLKRLSGVRTARSGNRLAAAGMLLAVLATLTLVWGGASAWILVLALVIGSGAGYALATRVEMTSMPELVAFFNGLGGAASMMVALAEVRRFSWAAGQTEGLLDVSAGATPDEAASVAVDAGVYLSERIVSGGELLGGPDFAVALTLSILIGAVTLSGSLVAFGKLTGKLKASRIGPLGNGPINLVLVAIVLLVCAWLAFGAASGGGMMVAMVLGTVLALALGVALVVPIGGADMPVVISLLNSYSGLAAAATGFALHNNLLVVAGTLVGASGLILTRIMCKAMNRSLSNVLFSGFGDVAAEKDESGYTNVKSTSAEEVAPILDAARSVIVVPGYGLAVAQAQHKVRELADLLKDRDCDVRYAIHPVAGRMPGHMNVLLAEADVPYEQLFDLDQINGEFKNADVAIVLGANDVCNPAASDPTSAIAGMPVLNVWEAQTVIVVKRSLSPGYAGIKNELFQNDNSLMLFGDAKQALEEIVSELKDM